MTDIDTLHRAILLDPSDDTLRLVYADALNDAGLVPEWAAFIRAQIELARLVTVRPDTMPGWKWRNMVRPYNEIVAQVVNYAPAWMIDHAGEPAKYRDGWLLKQTDKHCDTGAYIETRQSFMLQGSLIWHRGFVWRLTCPEHKFEAWAPPLFAIHPITEVFAYRRGWEAPVAKPELVNRGREMVGLPPLQPST